MESKGGNAVTRCSDSEHLEGGRGVELEMAAAAGGFSGAPGSSSLLSRLVANGATVESADEPPRSLESLRFACASAAGGCPGYCGVPFTQDVRVALEACGGVFREYHKGDAGEGAGALAVRASLSGAWSSACSGAIAV